MASSVEAPAGIVSSGKATSKCRADGVTIAETAHETAAPTRRVTRATNTARQKVLAALHKAPMTEPALLPTDRGRPTCGRWSWQDRALRCAGIRSGRRWLMVGKDRLRHPISNSPQDVMTFVKFFDLCFRTKQMYKKLAHLVDGVGDSA